MVNSFERFVNEYFDGKLLGTEVFPINSGSLEIKSEKKKVMAQRNLALSWISGEREEGAVGHVGEALVYTALSQVLIATSVGITPSPGQIDYVRGGPDYYFFTQNNSTDILAYGHCSIGRGNPNMALKPTILAPNKHLPHFPFTPKIHGLNNECIRRIYIAHDVDEAWSNHVLSIKESLLGAVSELLN